MTNYQKILSDLDATCGCTNAAAAAAVAIRELLAEREARNALTDARIIELRKDCYGGRFGHPGSGQWSDTLKFARAIEGEINGSHTQQAPTQPKQQFCPGQCEFEPCDTGSKCTTCGCQIPF